MNFLDIINNLGQQFKLDVISAKDNEINSIHLLDGREEIFDDDVLYFSFNELDIFPKNCIFVGNIQEGAIFDSLASISQDDFFAAYNFTENFLAINSKIDLLEDLENIARKSKDLSSFINQAALALNNPLVLIDRDFKIAAYSTLLPPKDSFWSKTVANGYCSYQTIKKNDETIEFMLEEKTRTAHLGKLSNFSNTPSIYSNIFKDGEIWGAVLMVAERSPITYEHYNYLPHISKLLEEVINRFDIAGSRDMTNVNSLFHKLLIGASIDDFDISSLDLKCGSRYMITTIQAMSNEGLNRKIMESICAFSNVLAFSMLRNKVVFLMALDDDGTYFDRKSDLINISEDKNLKVGISNVFVSLEFVRKAYEQSIFAINFPSKTVLNFYSSYYFADLLKKLSDSASESISWDEFIHPCLTILMNYDKKNNANLYNTLKIYLENNLKIKETSARLFLHRNSVKYRLDKIVELCKIDLEDSETVFLLQLSFHIMTYKGMKIIS